MSMDAYTARKALNVALLVLMALATVGFFVGTRAEFQAKGYSWYAAPEEEDVEGRIPTAMSYTERMSAPQRANDHLRYDFDRLATQAIPEGEGDATDPVLRALARSERAEGRAYEGAPPTIPHPIDHSGDAACLACHQTGLRIAARRAPAISHDTFTQCTQCHVEREARRPFQEVNPDAIPLDSAFVGFRESGDGPRVWEGAPPQMPHTSRMRENCASCHGPHGPPGLRTTHPERQNCEQCHAPNSALDHFPHSDLDDFGQR